MQISGQRTGLWMTEFPFYSLNLLFFCFPIAVFKTQSFFSRELTALQLFLMILRSSGPYHAVKALLSTTLVSDQLWLKPSLLNPV